MCWIGKKGDFKIAQEDIKVFKVCEKIDDTIHSIYHKDFIWELGKVYKSRIKKMYLRGDFYEVSKGFHSYDPKKVQIETASDYDCDSILRITTNEGMVNLDYFYYTLYNQLVKLECIIPKGSNYAVNSDGEAVSDTIKPISYEIIE